MSKDVRSRTAIAPGSLDFALHTLGWRNFQDLSSVILREFFGQTFKAFADSNDVTRRSGSPKRSHKKDSAEILPK